MSTDSSNASMTAVVEFQIRPENASMEEWLAVWQHRGEDARVGEPETRAYGTAVNVDDASNVLVFERYAHGDESLRKHTEREAHHALKATMGSRKMTKRRVMSTRFVDVPDYGWWGRPNAPDGLASGAGIALILLGMRFPNVSTRERFVRMTQAHAEYCWEAEPQTLIYSGGVATSDADREVDIKANDLVFVMACADDAAAVKHAEDPNHLALGAKFADEGIQMERTFMRTYRSTGHGFLWR